MLCAWSYLSICVDALSRLFAYLFSVNETTFRTELGVNKDSFFCSWCN
ncbi:unnamed protein product [Phytomonas sp. EM1]|nr:unnamed protein product [Phytomonas sp. EM1]|eukprot:CCW65124.1 unnamed protein product [Phytomonas sp. isolate EM1]